MLSDNALAPKAFMENQHWTWAREPVRNHQSIALTACLTVPAGLPIVTGSLKREDLE